VPGLADRFKAARERVGLAHDQFGWRAGISTPSVWDIETQDDELTSCYSPNEVRTFLTILQITPAELFGRQPEGPPVSPETLVKMAQDECARRNITLAEFEDIVGWELLPLVDKPDLVLTGMSLDGVSWLCNELKIDWLRVL
jgi:hypothetical protein